MLTIQDFFAPNFVIPHIYGKSIPENNIETLVEYSEARGMNSRHFAKTVQNRPKIFAIFVTFAILRFAIFAIIAICEIATFAISQITQLGL